MTRYKIHPPLPPRAGPVNRVGALYAARRNRQRRNDTAVPSTALSTDGGVVLSTDAGQLLTQ